MKLPSVFIGLLSLTMMIYSSNGRVMPLPKALPGRKMMAGDALIIGRTSKISIGILHADDMSDDKKPTNNEQNPKSEQVQGKDAAPLKLVHPPSIASNELGCASRERKLDSVEVANEKIFHLMRGDYSRGPPKAKRKPPINNHEPSN